MKTRQSCVHKYYNTEIPTVDIIMPVYNHEEFISEAIKSVLMQQTSYSYKIKIGEDCSTDSTRQIIMDYYEHYPDKIELYLWEKNVGGKRNHMELARGCKGKYIAYLEGDDYWTDPFKLQKQIAFLEKNEEYIGTAHNVRCIDRERNVLHQDFGLYSICEEHIYGKEQAEKFETAGQTASLLFRNIWQNWTQERAESFFLSEGNNDVKINVLLGLTGDVFCFRDVMADHRRIFQGDSWTAKSYNKNMLWFRYSSCSAIQKYLKKYLNISVDIEKLLSALFAESIVKLFCNFNKENLDVFLKFFERKYCIKK